MFSRIEHISLRGISACVPRRIERTLDYTWISEDERKMFMKSTGVEERRVAAEGTTAGDLCQHAAEALLRKLQWEKESIDVLIFVSQSPDYFLPATSAVLQHKLGLKKSTVAFDINLGCSGYIYGLYVLSNLLSSGSCKRGILLAGDKSTVSTNFKDKSTYPLFGDAGTASAFEFDGKAAPTFFNLFTDGSGYKAIRIEDGGCRSPLTESSYIDHKIEEGIERATKNLVLDGIEVFNFALREVAPGMQDIFAQSGHAVETIDYFVFHQANRLMNESVRKKCRIDAQKAPYSIDKFGNTSSASIPLTMLHSLRDRLEHQKLNLLLSGFGVGFSWGNCILQANAVTCTEILEAD